MTITDERSEVDLDTINPIPPYAENDALPPPAEPALDPKYRHCDTCGKNITVKNFRQHQLKLHDIGRTREYKPRIKPPRRERLQCPECDRTFERTVGLNSHMAKVHSKHPAVVEHGEGKQGEGPLTVDGIVATVVELRWPHTMPTKKALEMLEIRTALEKFLA